MPQNFTWPSISVSATNPSVGSNGITAPTSSTEVAGINNSGNLQPLQTDSSGNLKVAIASDTPTLPMNLTQVGGSAIALGQTTMSASLPVALASDQSPLAVSQSGTWTVQQGSAPWSQNLTQVGGTSFSLGQQLAAASLPVVLTASQLSTLTPLTSVTVTQSSGSNLHANIDNFPATQTIAGTVTANAGTGTFTVGQSTASNLLAQVSQPTASNLNATVVQSTPSNLQTQITAANGTLTDGSGTTSGTPSTSTQIFAANSSRRYLLIQNLDPTNNIYINFTSAASNGTGSYTLLPLGSLVQESSFVSTEAVNVLATVASVNFTAKQG